jgi:hypothetical protein
MYSIQIIANNVRFSVVGCLSAKQSDSEIFTEEKCPSVSDVRSEKIIETDALREIVQAETEQLVFHRRCCVSKPVYE